MPRTTVIMLTWNALQFTQITLTSLLKSEDHFDLIVFDNGSDQKSKEFLRSIAGDPRVKKIIFSDKNLGVWQGRYRASQLVGTPLVCFIDNDVCFPSHWLRNMEELFTQDSQVGEVGPLKLSKHLYHPYIKNNVKAFWHECEKVEKDPQKQLMRFTGGRDFNQFNKDLISANKGVSGNLEIPTRSIGGCVMLTKTDLYRNLQINDDTYSKFKYGLEDMDFSWSLFKAGYKIIKCTNVYIHHFEHSSVDENSLKINDKDNNQALVYFTTKWESLIIDWVDRKQLSGLSLEKIRQDEFISLILRTIPDELPIKLKKALQI